MNRQSVAIESPWYINNAPIVSFGILFIPLFDTLRVMGIRMMKGKSPFTADRNHIHHRILRLGFTHLQTTLILMFINGCFILLVFSLQNLDVHMLMLLIFSLGIVKSLIPAYIGRLWQARALRVMLADRNKSKVVPRAVQYKEVRLKVKPLSWVHDN
jgi:hypothetical protein